MSEFFEIKFVSRDNAYLLRSMGTVLSQVGKLLQVIGASTESPKESLSEDFEDHGEASQEQPVVPAAADKGSGRSDRQCSPEAVSTSGVADSPKVECELSGSSEAISGDAGNEVLARAVQRPAKANCKRKKRGPK